MHGKARTYSLGAALRGISCLSGLAMLAACSGHSPTASGPVVSQTQEAAVYKSRARANYAPPGPPGDPWGPYISEASTRFDVPPTWIREVMHVESNGYQFRPTGELTTSPVGAMGLMQLMPETYDEMRGRYNLGDDAYEPHDNILAGTAYLREMYDAFGTPGFLAAYNAGPNRLQAYLTNHGALPEETRRYVKIIGTRIAGVYPANRSPAEQLAMNQLPLNIAGGVRFPPHRTYMVAARRRSRHGESVQLASLERHGKYARHQVAAPVEVAEAPEPRLASYTTRVASASAAPHAGHGLHLHLIEPAMASDNVRLGGKDWAVQVGAYGNQSQAQAAAGAAHSQVAHTSASVAAVHAGHGTLYRARIGGMTHDAALQACHRLSHHGSNCLIVSPASQ